MPSAKAKITESVLVWARTQAGYSQDEAARRIPVKLERYVAWEDSDDELKPTIKQLRRIAKIFKRPASLFYLAEPPQGFQPMRDFRRLPGDGIRSYSPSLLQEMVLAQQRRNLALELYEEIGENPSKFSMTAMLDEPPESLGAKIRKQLGIDFSDQVTWRRHGALGPFKAWRRELEAKGILVFQMGSVNRDEINGFALAEKTLPLIAVNRKDPPNRRTFSLLHELVHIMLKVSGASDLYDDPKRPPEEQKIEIFCNQVAASALMPSEHVLELSVFRSNPGRNAKWEDKDIREASDLFGVSREAFLRRLLTLKRTTKTFYETKRVQYAKEFRDELERRRKQQRESGKEFRKNPLQDVYVELGRPFVRLMFDSIRQDLLTLNEASGYLGNLRIRHFAKLEERIYAR